MNNAIPDDVKHLVGDEMMDTVPQKATTTSITRASSRSTAPKRYARARIKTPTTKGQTTPWRGASLPTTSSIRRRQNVLTTLRPATSDFSSQGTGCERICVSWSTTTCSGSRARSQSKLVAFGGDRLRQLEKILVPKPCRPSLSRWRTSTVIRWATGSGRSSRRVPGRNWRPCEKRSAQLARADHARKARTDGVLPADIGVTDCDPETWREFKAFCNGSGLRESSRSKSASCGGSSRARRKRKVSRERWQSIPRTSQTSDRTCTGTT